MNEFRPVVLISFAMKCIGKTVEGELMKQTDLLWTVCQLSVLNLINTPLQKEKLMLDFWLLIFYIISIQHSPLSPVAEKADFELDPHLARGEFSTFCFKDLRGCM